MNTFVLVLALCAIAAAYPRPAEVVSKDDSSETDTELVSVPLEREQPRRTFRLGFGFPGPFGARPFAQDDSFFRPSPWGYQPSNADADEADDFIKQMRDMLLEMRKQMTALAEHAHREHGIGGDDDSVGTRIGDDDLPKNQTTSETKVIDGHIVTVNETTYSSGDDGIGAVIRIKVVEVHPSESPEEEGEPEVKPDEASSETPDVNETTDKKSEIDDDSQETNEIPNQKEEYKWSPEFDPAINEIEPQGSESTPSKAEVFYDLSDDTKVNDFHADEAHSQGLVMIDPDAELINSDANSYYRYDMETQRTQNL